MYLVTVVVGHVHIFKKAGLIQNPSWGKVQITDAGKALLSQNPDKIDLSLLNQYPRFMEFWNRISSTETDQAPRAKAESSQPKRRPLNSSPLYMTNCVGRFRPNFCPK